MKNACEFPVKDIDYNDWNELMKLITDVQKDACPAVNPKYIDAGAKGITIMLFHKDAYKALNIGPPPK